MVLFAFSVQDQVEKYGAYVGIAAFFGLAVLSLLYFSQARELKRLREWAGRAPERARELEQRVVAQATATVARRPPAMPTATGTGGIAPPRRLAEMPAPPAAQTAAAAQATEVTEGEQATNGNVPAPPVGPGGSVPAGPPANGAVPSDATQVAPPPEGEEAAATPNGATSEGAPAAEGDGGPAEGAGEADDTAKAAAAAAGAGAVAGAGAAAAAAAAGAADAAARDDAAEERDATVPGEIPPAAAVPRATPAQRVGVTPRPQPMPLRQSTPSATPRGGGGRPAAPAGRRPGAAKPPREGRSGGTIALFVGLAVLILGGGTWGVSQILGGDDAPPPRNQTAPPPTQTAEPGTAEESGGGNAAEPSPPEETNVAVLNGTTSTGLAGALADQLTAKGYQRGVVETNTRDQTIQASTVYYADGERATARAVARQLSIQNVEPLDPETESLAPEADLVVLAGADQAP